MGACHVEVKSRTVVGGEIGAGGSGQIGVGVAGGATAGISGGAHGGGSAGLGASAQGGFNFNAGVTAPSLTVDVTPKITTGVAVQGGGSII
jgi:hypothetical protein